MPRKLTDPSAADLDAMLRAAHRRGRLDHLDGGAGDPGTAPAEPEAPRPGPLPGGAAQSSLGMAPPDPDKWIRAAIDAKKFGTPMPAPQYLTRDA